MLKTRILSTSLELRCFRARYRALASVPVDLDYLREGRVRGFFDRRGRMLGGYVLNAGPRLRYLAALPAGTALPDGLVPEQMCEVTCIWFDRAMGTAARLSAYGVVLWDLLRHGRRHVVGGSFVPKVARIQRLGLPHGIFEGTARVGGHASWASVYYGTLGTAARGLLRLTARRLASALDRRRGRSLAPAPPRRLGYAPRASEP